LKKSRKGLLLLLLLPELVLLLLLLLVAGEAVAEADEVVAEAGHWPSLLLRSEGEKKNVYLLPIHKDTKKKNREMYFMYCIINLEGIGTKSYIQYILYKEGLSDI
jgi:hypothetical protein